MRDNSDLAAFSCSFEPNTEAPWEFYLCALDAYVGE